MTEIPAGEVPTQPGVYPEREALGQALHALVAAEQYHSRRCAKDQPHDHELLRKLQAAIKLCDAALVGQITDPDKVQG